jgi:2-(1,2-epoxy-1,2-dihydrophenyl)acetyl-CoA isomerase
MSAAEHSTIIQCEQASGTATITFNRPEARNALTSEMMNSLLDIVGAIESDPAVRCVLLRGAGECFMAGGDVRNFQRQLTEDRSAYVTGMEARVTRSHLVISRLRRMQKPVIASVHGAVSGIGLGLMLAADLVIAAERTVFVLAHRHIGLSPDGGASYFLPRAVGERRALEIALFGGRLDAAKALEWGLINWVAPRDDLARRTAEIVHDLASGPTLAMGHAKTLVRSSLENDWEHVSAEECRRVGMLVASDDHAEGVGAFLEKRRPVFHGK